MKGLLLLCLTAVVLTRPLVLKAQQDTVWGMTGYDGVNGYGSLFSMQPDGTNLQVAYSFTGSDGNAAGSLIQYKGSIYGMTTGEIFSYNPTTSAFTPLYTFNYSTDGTPSGKLTLDPDNGRFYGVTQLGGANGAGLIFSFDPATNTYTDVYDLNTSTGDNPPGPLTFYNHVFYGLAADGANYAGVIFSFDPAADVYTDLYDATDLYPGQVDGSLAVIAGKLYGVGMGGGYYGDGVLFSFNPVSHTYTDLYDFNGYGRPTALSNPVGIIASGSTIYGVTQGYTYNYDQNGTIFSFNTGTQTMTPLYVFDGITAATPTGNLTLVNGNLLGLSSAGGANFDGTIYSYSLASNTASDLFDLNFNNSPVGDYPNLCQLLLVHPVGTTPQTITFGDVTRNYGDAPYDPGAVVSSGLPVTYNSDNPGVAYVNGQNQVQIVGAGTTNISAFQEGNATYDSITVTHQLTVLPVPLLIAAVDTIRNQDQPNPVFRIVYTGLVNGDTAGSLPVAPTVMTTADENSLQGTYAITVNGAVDPNYTITYQDATLTVIGLLQHITFTDSTAVYGGPNVVGEATASSGLPVTYTSSHPSIVAITPDQQLQILTTGTTQLIATQAGDADYASTMDTILFVVKPVPLMISAENKTKVYNQPDPVFTAIYEGFINGDDTNSLTSKPVFTTTAVPGAPPGAYVINVGSAADSNYTISYASATFVLTPVQGDAVNSLNAWFSSKTTLQTGIWVTASQPALLQVYDVAGQRLVAQQINLVEGYNALTFPAGGWVSGIYIIRLTGEGLNLNKNIQKIN